MRHEVPWDNQFLSFTWKPFFSRTLVWLKNNTNILFASQGIINLPFRENVKKNDLLHTGRAVKLMGNWLGKLRRKVTDVWIWHFVTSVCVCYFRFRSILKSSPEIVSNCGEITKFGCWWLNVSLPCTGCRPFLWQFVYCRPLTWNCENHMKLNSVYVEFTCTIKKMSLSDNIQA